MFLQFPVRRHLPRCADAPRPSALAAVLALALTAACTPQGSDGGPSDGGPLDRGLEAGQLGGVDAESPEAGPDATPDAAPDAGPAVDRGSPDRDLPDMRPPRPPECGDFRDNDGDGRRDLLDPGCVSATDDDERDPDPLPACGDGLDNDGDGDTDYPDDDACEAAGGTFEGSPCAEGLRIVELGPEGGRAEVIPEDGGALAIASCGEGIGRESVIAITLDEPSRMEVAVTGPLPDIDVLVYVRSACRSRVSEVACAAPGAAPPLRVGPQPAGTYFVFVQWAAPGVVPTPLDVEVTVRSALTQCNDGRDNDGDGLTDLLDPGCRRPDDDNERQIADANPQCSNGLDDDGDGRVDYPADGQCLAAGDPSEAPLCPGFADEIEEFGAGFHIIRDRIDPDERGRASGSCGGYDGERVYALVVDAPSLLAFEPDQGPQRPDAVYLRADCDDRGSEVECYRFPSGQQRIERLDPGTYFLFVEGDPFDPVEFEIWLELSVLPPPVCDDGVDNDGDGALDLDDPGCEGPGDQTEAPDRPGQCADGVDNDGDGDVDYPDDAHCAAAGDPIEALRCLDRPTIEMGAAGGSVFVESDGPSTDAGTCGGRTFPEAIIALTLDEPSAVRVSSNDFSDYVYIRGACDAPATQVSCGRETTTAERLEPGTWFVFVELDDFGGAASQVDIEVFGLLRACSDGVDNDGDGLIDALDPGCARAGDDDEDDPAIPAPCANGADDDGDGRVDHPDDPECDYAGGDTETDHCVDDWPVFALGPDGGEIETALDLRGALSRGDCGPFGGSRESAIALTLDGPSDVTLSTVGDAPMTFSLRAACARDAAEVACGRGDVTFERLPAGVWYVLAQPSQPGMTRVRVSVRPVDADCNDGLDNDGDGRTDLDDPGCAQPLDDSERDPIAGAACGNELDDDGDGFVDFPDDPGCRARGDDSEVLHCAGPWHTIEVGQAGGRFPVPAQRGVSLTGGRCDFDDGGREAVLVLTLEERSLVLVSVDDFDTTLYARAECDAPDSEFACERFDDRLELGDLPPGTHYLFVDPGAPRAVTVDVAVFPLVRDCADDIDNDGDGAIDTADPGCVDARDDDEADPEALPACADGLDNDGDGAIDWPDDGDCTGAGGAVEQARCRAAVPVLEVGPEGGLIEVPRQVESGVMDSTCRASGDVLETVLALRLDELSRVRLEVLDGPRTGLSARTTCDLPNSELACEDFTNRLTVPEAEAGVLYLIVEPEEEAPVQVQVTVESLVRDCGDGVDNDADGAIDADDLGCRDRFDDEEADDPDPPPACGDGIDNDDDGRIDWPADPDCAAAGGPVELARCAAEVPVIEIGGEGAVLDLPPVLGAGVFAPGCRNILSSKETVLAVTVDELSRIEVEVDEPNVTLHARSSCDAPESELACEGFDGRLRLPAQPAGTVFVVVDPVGEGPITARVEVESLIRACNDGLDTDGDGLIDLDDPGCVDGSDDDEQDPPDPPICADGLDNDGDGDVDYPDDPGCLAAGDFDEAILCDVAPVVAVLVDAGGDVETDTDGLVDSIQLGCAGGQAGENVIVIRLTAPARLDAEVIAADYDTALELRRACDDPQAVVQCDDDGGVNLLSRITEPVLEAGTYFLIVDGFSFNSGTATVSVDIQPL